MTTSFRTRPTNQWCTECSEEVRIHTLSLGTLEPRIDVEHCSCTLALCAKTSITWEEIEEHKSSKWRPL